MSSPNTMELLTPGFCNFLISSAIQIGLAFILGFCILFYLGVIKDYIFKHWPDTHSDPMAVYYQ